MAAFWMVFDDKSVMSAWIALTELPELQVYLARRLPAKVPVAAGDVT